MFPEMYSDPQARYSIWMERNPQPLGFLTSLCDHGRVRISTLGPDGTSSAAAARHIGSSVGGDPRLLLRNSYEDAAEDVAEHRADCLVVANAYAGINRFYISKKLVLATAFPFMTPPYGVAIRRDTKRPENTFKLATHPAPRHLINDWFTVQQLSNLVVIEASSTSAAAKMVDAGEVCACITTEPARRKHKLAFITQTVRIPMLWSVFVSTNHKIFLWST